MDLKAGDKVLVLACYHKYVSVVEKITPAGNIRLKDGGLYTPDGTLKTKDAWNNSHIQPLTPELEESLRRDMYVSKTLTIMQETSNITYAQAVEIRRILEGGQNGENV